MPPIRPLLAAAVLAATVGGCQPPGAATATAIAPTYQDIAAKVFANGCTTSSCHGSGAPRGNLDLTTDKAYDQLVGVLADNTSAAKAGKKRVVPGDPAASFLVEKLEGPAPGDGDRMPRVGPALDAAAIAAIKAWITAGAPRN